VVALQLFTTVKRENAIAQKLENGSSNHGEPFFLGSLTASPQPPPKEGEQERKKKKNRME